MPAPFRYVVGKPGDPAAEYDSMSFSAWIQPANQEAIATTAVQETPGTGVVAPSEGAALGGTTVLDDGPPPAEPPNEIVNFAGMLTGATGGAAGVGGAFWRMIHTTWAIVTGNANGTDDDPAQLAHVLEGARGASGTTLTVHPQGIQWDDSWRPDEWPADAIGYEVEQVELSPGFWAPVAEPLSVNIDVSLAPATYFGEITGLYAVTALNSQWGTGDAAWGYAGQLLDMTLHQRAASTLVAADDREFGWTAVEVPIEGVLSPAHVASFTLDDFSYAPPYTGAVGIHSQVGGYPGSTGGAVIPVLDDGVRLEVYANPSVTGVYTIRPPRFRWIYAREPYRRTYPRDDSLAGGATRTWPPPRSIQSSRRTFGGYL